MDEMRDSTAENEVKTSDREQVASCEALLSELEKMSSPKEKIERLLRFMEYLLSQEGGERLGEFWKAKKICLPLFKEKVPAASRSALWSEYIELGRQADHLKSVQEENSSFIVEQLEAALGDLEGSIARFDALAASSPDPEIPSFSDKRLQQKTKDYLPRQKELAFLQTMISRLHSLRQEVMKTAMRAKVKNQFFQRLSVCGDFLFSKRKELVDLLSQEFSEDVDSFIADYFGQSKKSVPYYVLKQEIKSLQEMAKHLSLKPKFFSQTREKLSSCWDQIKDKEKERRKVLDEKREIFQKNHDLLQEQIAAFSQQCREEPLDTSALAKQREEIVQQIRQAELGREEVQAVKTALDLAYEPLAEQERAAKAERERIREETEKKKRDFFARAQSLEASHTELSVQELQKAKEQLLEEKKSYLFSQEESERLDALFVLIARRISKAHESSLLTRNGEALRTELEALYQEREQEFEQCKRAIDELRRSLGGSGYGFDTALYLQEQLQQEKTRLEELEESLNQIEEKMDSL